MAKRLMLGVDIGGTGVKLALVDTNGSVVRHSRFPTPKEVTGAVAARRIADEAATFIGKTSGIRGAGIGCAGDIDSERGIVRSSANLGWRIVPLAATFQSRLGVRVRVENDANMAAWGAFRLEVRSQPRVLMCVTLGTGVGGGLVIDGKLFRGASGSAGEWGHMTLYPDGLACPCGNRGCLERYVGAKALTAQARAVLETRPRTRVLRLIEGDLQRLTPAVLQQAAGQGDKVARALWNEAGIHLGVGIASLVNILNPDCIVLCGGLSRAANLLLPPLRRVLRERAFRTAARTVKIVSAKLDQDLGVVGAGLLAHETFQ